MPTTYGAKGRARRAELVELGRRALVEGGLDAVVLRELAARAGMTLGNLQYYFRSRDDLLEAIVCDAFAADLDAVRTVATPSSLPPGDGGAPGGGVDLDELADRLHAQWAGDAGAVFGALALLARHERRFAALHQELYASFTAALVEVLRRFDPGADDAALGVRARLVTAVLDGLALQVVGAEPDECRAAEPAWAAGKALVAALAAGRVPEG